MGVSKEKPDALPGRLRVTRREDFPARRRGRAIGEEKGGQKIINENFKLQAQKGIIKRQKEENRSGGRKCEMSRRSDKEGERRKEESPLKDETDQQNITKGRRTGS